MIRAAAYAKVNLGLRVGRRRSDGFHPVHGVFQSVGVADDLWIDTAADDHYESAAGPFIAGADNLAWRALVAARRAVAAKTGMLLRLRKRIPVAAGLGGGSADAAAALGVAASMFDLDGPTTRSLAEDLGSDVPFCLVGGTALVSGRGEEIDVLDPLSGFALAVVVPPAELSTPRVFAKWDALDGPRGRPIAASALPPAVRTHAPLVNDLEPAARAESPLVEEWTELLADAWGRPVLLSGSGPSLYAFFVDDEEATAALDAVPAGSRAAIAVAPIAHGWTWSTGTTVQGPDGRRLDGWPPDLAPPE